MFGSTIRRLTSDQGAATIYSANNRWNANGTRYINAGRGDIYSTATGALEYHNLPRGPLPDDVGFDPIDPNVYFYWTGAQVRKITVLSSGTYSDTLYFTAPSTLLSLGGSVDWMDAQGNYMILRYGSEPSVHVFDRNNLAAGAYTNGISAAAITIDRAFVGITPDGKYAASQKQAWSLNHGTRTVSTSPTWFWSLCGGHGDHLSASDGRDYWISSDCISGPLIELWRVDITNNVGADHRSVQKAAPNNRLLLTVSPATVNTHVTAVARGAMRDWAFYSIENPADVFNGGVASWPAYGSEIIAINVLTLEVRRLAHHRSRSTNTDYASEPRPSTSWTGNVVGWASNFNRRGIVDVFAIPFQPGPSAPVNLRIQVQ